MTRYNPGRVSPFGNPRIKACLQLPEAYRSLPRPSSPSSAKASPVCPYELDRNWVLFLVLIESAVLRRTPACRNTPFPEDRSRPGMRAYPNSQSSIVKERRSQTVRLDSVERAPVEPKLVEITGIEPVTSGLQSRRSPS